MKMRQRLANWIAPPHPTTGVTVKRHVYAIGPQGMVELRSKSNPLSDLFHGITNSDDALFTNTADGYARAYQASVWAFKCVRTRARTLASIPIAINNSAGEPVHHPLSWVLGKRNTRLMYYTEADMQVYGESFWRYGMYPNGNAWARRLNPQTIETVADVSGVQGYIQRIDGQVVGEWEPREVAHFFDYHPGDDMGGLSPTALALGAIGVTVNISLYAEYFFKNGAMPSGILVSETRMQDVDKERVLGEWKRRFQGTEKAHETALLDGGRITYQPISPAPKDLAMPELREAEIREICAAYDVPQSIAQAADPALYAAKQDYANFHTLAVLPELDMILDTINTQIVPWYGVAGATAEPNLNEVEALQEDRAEITQRNAAGVAAGYLSLNTALERESEEPLKTDWFIIGGRLVPKTMLDTGDMDGLRELGIVGTPEPASPFPFMGMPELSPVESQRALPEPRIIDQPPTRAHVDIVVHAADDVNGRAARMAVLADTLLRDLDRWQRKVLKRGPGVDFNPDYLPPALTDWLRADLRAWDGETEREDWINAAFVRAEHIIRAEDPNLATPEEFEAYWRGIGELFDAVARTFEDYWQDFPAKLATALRESGQAGATFDMATFLAAQEGALIEALTGEDGPLTQVVLAGAARGNDLLAQAKSVRQDALTIDWQIIDTYAREWAREYAAQQVRGINDTTQAIFRQKIAEWIDAGGTLEDLAKYIEGDLADLDIPDGWSPGKVAWATSRERARLIAQTETTAAFHEGAVTRWEQADVPQKKFRTQNDVHVDDEICRPLNNVVTTIRGLWTHPKTGEQYGVPAHPGCRCFASPTGF